MTLKEYRQMRKTALKNLIPSSFQSVTWLAPYFAHPENYDLQFCEVDYASLELVSEEENVIDSIIAGTLYSNAYRFEKLFETLSLEYNPIWNVDGTEMITYSPETKTTNIGQRSETVESGERSTTSTIGERNSEDTFKSVPYELTDEYETGATARVTSETSDTIVSDAVTDKKTTSATSDSETTMQHTTTTVRSGNIGVTSTQSLITQERQIADFNYVAQIMDEIVNAITIPYWGQTSNSGFGCAGCVEEIAHMLGGRY